MSHVANIVNDMRNWKLTSLDEQALGVFERKILRKIYGPFCDRGEYVESNISAASVNEDRDLSIRLSSQQLCYFASSFF